MSVRPATSPQVPLVPRRSGAWRALLWYGLLIPPVVWAVQLELNYGLASHACFPIGTPRASFVPGWERIWVVLLVVNLVCLAICAIGLLASGSSWRRLRDEQPVEGEVGGIAYPSQERLRAFAVSGATGERDVHGRHLVQHPLPLGALDMLTGLARRAMRALLLALIGSAALGAGNSFPPLAPGIARAWRCAHRREGLRRLPHDPRHRGRERIGRPSV